MKTQTKIILAAFFLFSLLCSFVTIANAEIPRLINYQGRLTDSTSRPLDGTYKLNFKIYNSAGTMLWQGTHNSVLVQKGVFSVLLGDANDAPYNFSQLAFDEPYFLEIKVCKLEGANEICEVLSPRQQITSSAYAIRAAIAEDVASLTRGVIVMWSGRISNIPSGWALCDGTDGTPDLRDKFIVGARQDEGGVAKTNITGTLTQNGDSTIISIDNLPSHTHSAGTLFTNTTGLHTHGLPITSDMEKGGGLPGAGGGEPLSTGPAGEHSHTISGSTGATGSGTSYAQPYYALAYIMKL